MEVEGSGGVPGFAMLVGKDKILGAGAGAGAGERIISAASLAVEVLTHTQSLHNLNLWKARSNVVCVGVLDRRTFNSGNAV